MKIFFYIILFYTLAGFFFTSSAQKDIVINTNRSSSIRSYIAPLITGDDILNVYPQNANYWTGSIDTSGGIEVSLVKANGNGVGWMVFDISGIPPGSIINSITFYGYVYDNNWPYWSITPMGTVNPIPPNPPEIILQIISNYKQENAYSFNTESGTLPVGWLNRALDNNATADLQNAIPQGWFAIGFTDFDISNAYYIDFQGWAEANVPYLVVDCTSPTPHDVGTLSIDIPDYVNPGVITPRATVFSNSNTTETFDVTMTIAPGAYSSTKTVTNILPGGTQQVTFDNWTAVNFTSYTLEACTQLAIDPDPSNDCKSKNVYCYDSQWVLYDQTAGGNTNGYTSQDFEAAFDIYDSFIADDFVVTAPGWTIDHVVVSGQYSMAGPAAGFNVYFYSNGGGLPGALVYSALNQPYTYDGGSIFTINLETPQAVLTPGDYWVSVQCRMDFGVGGQWYWNQVDGAYASVAAWQNPGGGFGICPAWGNIQTCIAAVGTDMYFALYCYCLIPVELTSFTINADFGVTELQWITATETNNSGFEVQRKSGGEFETLAFVEGHRTTTEPQAYSYSDKNVNAGSYSYRLKQVDLDGTFEYSDVVEVDVSAPAVFALDQNYPNPFNPSTMISFRLAVDSKVSMTVFNVLGQEVASLLNSNLVAGSHQVNFDASSLNSGVYMYRIEANGIDGTNFVDVKKMILTK